MSMYYTIDTKTIDSAKIQGDGALGEWGHFIGPQAHEAAAFVHDQMKTWVDVEGVKSPEKYRVFRGLIYAAQLVFDVQRIFTKPVPRMKKYKTK